MTPCQMQYTISLLVILLKMHPLNLNGTMKICWKALQRPVVRAQQNTKTRQATTQTTLFLIWLTTLAMIDKRSKHRLKKEIFIIVKNIILTKNWFVVINFWVKFTTFRIFQLQSTQDRLIKHIFCTETTSASFFWGGMIFRLIRNPFIKIKKQLMLTNFTHVMYKIAEKY